MEVKLRNERKRMRVLIINTQSVNHNNATGVTLRSILREYPPDDILELYMQPCVRAEDALPIRSIQLKFREIPIRTIANRFFGKSAGSVSAPPTGAAPSFQSKLKSRLAMSVDFEKVFLSGRIGKMVAEFNPGCIYTLGNAVDAMKYACAVSDRYGLHILPHFMDNWQESHRYGKNKYPMHLRSTQKWLRKMYEKSVCALAISERMAQEYEKRWNIHHYALMNAVDVPLYRQNQPQKNTGILVYAGGLHLNRYQSLIQIAEALEEQNKTEKRYTLEIYTDGKSKTLYQNAFEKFSCVTFMDYVKHDDIGSVYDRAEILVHIETFDTAYHDFILYSLSTKISEYLATGIPILLYAPGDIFVSEYLRKNCAAAVISDSDRLKDTLHRLTRDSDYRMVISQNAQNLALEKHDLASSLKTFETAVHNSGNNIQDKEKHHVTL